MGSQRGGAGGASCCYPSSEGIRCGIGNRYGSNSECKPMDFVDTSLRDVMAFLAEREGIAIQLDIRALEKVGIGPDSAISFKLRNETTLRTVMGRVLKSTR